MGAGYNIHLDGSVVGAVINNQGTVNQTVPDKHSGFTETEDSFDMQVILDDLKKVRDELATTKETVDDLRSAIESGDEKAKAKNLKSLSGDVASAILKTLASETLKKFLRFS